jgi:hypothetical protein
MKYIKYILISAIVAFASCESMDETYEEFTGDGKIRYTGKISDLKVESGYERFKLSWTNSSDPTIEKIKIVWQNELLKDSVLVDGDLESYLTDVVFGDNKTYAFHVYSIDKESHESLRTTAYGRAYSQEHEELTSVNTIERKYFFIGDKLLLMLNDLDERVTNPVLRYYSDGEEMELAITEEHFTSGFLIVDQVDASADVKFSRTIQLDNSIDPIDIKPYVLNSVVKNFNPDFLEHLKMTYQKEQIDIDFIEQTKVLQLDYSLKNLEDVLHFPNLEKVVIGTNRYMSESPFFSTLSTLSDKDLSVFALERLNELLGTTVEVYNNHYGISSLLSFATDMGNPVLPVVEPLDHTNWVITCSTDIENVSSNPGNLLDNDANTLWETLQSNTNEGGVAKRDHEVVIDMQKTEQLNGFLIRQAFYTEGWGATAIGDYLPENIQIYLSDDGFSWHDALVQSSRVLGKDKLETTLVYLPEGKSSRYVKFIVKDGLRYNYYKQAILADFVIF